MPKSKTPFKSISKINIQEQNTKEKNDIPELVTLNQLISEYGYDAVLNSLYKPKSSQSNKLESCLQKLKDSCTNDKLPLILFKMFFSYFDSKIEDIKNQNKRTTSSKKSDSSKNNSENKKLEKNPSKSKNNETKSIFTIKEQNNKFIPPLIIDKDEEKQGNKKKQTDKKIISIENNKKQNKKSPIKEDVKIGKNSNNYIGSHYNKDEEGHIYKYQVANLDGKGNAIFKCYDYRCCGMGIYEIETTKFSLFKNHSLKHEEHEYIVNYDKDEDDVFKDLIDMEKSDAQIFKENGERTVKLY